MKKFLVLFLVMMAAPCWAIPHLINYQGYLTRADGTALDTTVAVTFKLHNAPAGGSMLWAETRPDVTAQGGIFSVRLGDVTPLPAPVLNLPELWLGVTVGNNTEMTPRVQVTSVGYAYRVGTIDGASGGTISSDVTITGKGNIGWSNLNSGNWSFVAGAGNEVTGAYSTITGGRNNTADGDSSVIGGGYYNATSGALGTIGGGKANQASGAAATVGGGAWNRARGNYSVIAGGGGPLLADTNSASGIYSSIGGGNHNRTTSSWATISGGYDNYAYGNGSFIGGGQSNVSGSTASVVSGGLANSAIGYNSGVCAGQDNRADTHGSFVGGGRNNRATGLFSAVVGGGDYSAADSNAASGDYAFVGGGTDNWASGDSSVVSGGSHNTASGQGATIGGGRNNAASGSSSTIAGGNSNSTSSGSSFIGGGYQNSMGNQSFATIGGGFLNYVNGAYAVIPGGYNNRATGAFSFAAGRSAVASGDGVFAWADATGDTFGIGSSNTFNARASGGVRFWTTSDITQNIGARLPAGGSTWTTLSDSTKKRNIRTVDTKVVLDKVAQMPIKQWSYVSQDPSIEHIGPMAQDFWNLFHIGDDSLSISTIDPGGIALAAIQELAKQNEELRNQLSGLRAQFQSHLANEQQTSHTEQ